MNFFCQSFLFFLSSPTAPKTSTSRATSRTEKASDGAADFFATFRRFGPLTTSDTFEDWGVRGGPSLTADEECPFLVFEVVFVDVSDCLQGLRRRRWPLLWEALWEARPSHLLRSAFVDDWIWGTSNGFKECVTYKDISGGQCATWDRSKRASSTQVPDSPHPPRCSYVQTRN
jgi:hypothetical protein